MTTEKNKDKPVAMPFRKDQTGMGQANQALWDAGEAGKVIAPPPDAVPGKNIERDTKK